MMNKKFILTGVATALISMSALTQAAGKVDPSIKYRHHAMEMVKDTASSISNIFKGKEDPKNFSVHANALAASIRASIVAFEKKVPGGDTHADTWKNWTDFATRMDKFATDADALAAASGADMKTKGAALKQVFSNCKACHDKYRAE